MKKVLVVLTAAEHITLKNGEKRKSGYFLGELTDPLEALIEAGFAFDIATPGGRTPPMDPKGLFAFYWSFNFKARRRALKWLDQSEEMQKPKNLDELKTADLEKYAGVLMPGGHGPTEDLRIHPKVREILFHFHEQQKPTALLCHAPIVMTSAMKDGAWIYKGYKVSIVSDLEEKIAEAIFFRGKVSFEYPESWLRRLGANVTVTKSFVKPTAMRDRELITGQNPYAGRKFGRLFVEALRDDDDHNIKKPQV